MAFLQYVHISLLGESKFSLYYCQHTLTNVFVSFSLEDISGAEVEIRTVDYIFPMNQSMPNPKPKTWIVNILTRHPQAEDCYKVTAVLFTCAGSPEESRIVFEGHGYFHTSEISLTLLGFCNLVKDTGIGIFAGATEGRASFANHWGRKIHKSPPPESELSAPGLRLCPVSWTFLLSRELARALELALSRENVPIIFDWGERGRPPWIT